jgi:hypothetical protein
LPQTEAAAPSNCIGIRTFTEVWPLSPVIDSSASTSTRKYFARVFTVVPLPLVAPKYSPAGAVKLGARAAISRSASSAVIFPAASISRI